MVCRRNLQTPALSAPHSLPQDEWWLKVKENGLSKNISTQTTYHRGVNVVADMRICHLLRQTLKEFAKCKNQAFSLNCFVLEILSNKMYVIYVNMQCISYHYC